ncbi:MAG: hypothetical protein J0H01_26345 [Rhizobiales bacterium]|nr:hypothetical protein [Hyphomicrobiales bacterium]
MDPLQAYMIWQGEKSAPRNQNPLRLGQYGYKSFSQSDEDGIIQEIFFRIGTGDKTFVEFGVETGLECNTALLLMQGWSGLWIEGDEKSCSKIKSTHKPFVDDARLSIENAHVDRDNINQIISGRYAGGEIDLLSIDIDSNDYWIWSAIDCVSPRVVIVEYNASWPPSATITVPYDPNARWNGTNLFGASLGALAKLSDHKGYKLVGCSLSGVNAFFVRDDLVEDKFFAPGSPREHYEPPRYCLAKMPAGHPPMIGPVVDVGR